MNTHLDNKNTVVNFYYMFRCFFHAVIKRLQQTLKRKLPEDDVNYTETSRNNIRLCAFVGVMNEWLIPKQFIFDNFAYK
jgi:hypothetical protein